MEGLRISVLVWVALLGLLLPSMCNARQACSEVSKAYGKIGFSPVEVPSVAVAGDHLKVCSKGYTCCTAQMETNLSHKARQWFDQRLIRITQASRDTLVTRTVKLNDFFLHLIQRCQDDLNDMFIKAYGLQYMQNVAVFQELFQNLRRFFLPGAEANVSDAVRKFFTDIFSRMFAMLNMQHSMDANYLQCVSTQVGPLRPFGDIPDTLARNIKQAFVAAKMFVQGLAVGRDIALKAPTVEPNAACFRAVTKMLYCQQCRGGDDVGAAISVDVRPCHDYCLNVARGCLAQHYELSDSWNRYLEAMDELGARLEGAGAFNIEAVLAPLKDMISTAIMEYHDNNNDFTEKLFASKACGQPKGSRSPRELLPNNSTQARERRAAAASRDRLSLHQGSAVTLDRLVRDARSKLKQLQGMWRSAAAELCSDSSVVATAGTSRCWNGYDVARYMVPLQGDGVANNVNNPEVRVLPGERTSIGNLTEQLKLVTNRIRDAMQGIDVDWLVLDIQRKEDSPNARETNMFVDSDDDGDQDGYGSGGTKNGRQPVGSGLSSDRGWPLRTLRPNPAGNSYKEPGSGWRPPHKTVSDRGQLDVDDTDDDDKEGSGSGGGSAHTPSYSPNRLTARPSAHSPITDIVHRQPPTVDNERTNTGDKRTQGSNHHAAVRAGGESVLRLSLYSTVAACATAAAALLVQ